MINGKSNTMYIHNICNIIYLCIRICKLIYYINTYGTIINILILYKLNYQE